MATADDGLSGNLRFSLNLNIPVKPLILSLCECTYGEYYGLVVVAPPPRLHPQTFHHSHDNLKNPNRIASIFYMHIDIGERIAGKQDGPGPIIYGPPRDPRIAKNAHF